MRRDSKWCTKIKHTKKGVMERLRNKYINDIANKKQNGRSHSIIKCRIKVFD